MSRFTRHLRLVALFVLVAVSALPTARPAYAASFVVNSTDDTDNGTCPATCTLREALRLADDNGVPDTITFNIPGAAPHEIDIDPANGALPALDEGKTSIIVSPTHSVVLNGSLISAFGLRIRSSENLVRGLVIVGFNGGTASGGGSGISLKSPSAHHNIIADNWIGLNADGTTTNGNAFYGVQLDEGAHDNTIGGTDPADRNVIVGNLRANIAVDDSDTSSSYFIDGNQIIGNYIGVNPSGAVPATVDQSKLEAGVLVGTYAEDTLIKGNLIGGHLGDSTIVPSVTAGVVIQSNEITVGSTKHPVRTKIVANDIGVTPSGGIIRNHNGIRINGGSIGTQIGDPKDPIGGRNAIGNTEEDAIQIADFGFDIRNTEIVGNYIGIARDGTTLAPIGTAGSSSLHNTGIYLGVVTNSGSPDPATQVGPANVIAATHYYGIRVRSNKNVIKGNFIGTNVTGTATSPTQRSTGPAGYGPGEAGIWVDNGSENMIGGPNGGDRNVIAAGQSTSYSFSPAGIILLTGSSCGSLTCAINATTIQGNYVGVSSSGAAALAGSTTVETKGILISNSRTSTTTVAPTNVVVRGNVISGLGTGISLVRGTSNSIIDGNLIGTRASGSLNPAHALGNLSNGIHLTAGSGSGNQITNNTVAFNSKGSSFGIIYAGITVDNLIYGGGSNNTLSGNRLMSNGINTEDSGVYVNGTTGVRISQTTTSSHVGDGISLAYGGNLGLTKPTLSSVAGPISNATLTGSSSCLNCKVEVFTSATAENGEGPIYLAEGDTNGSGGFTVNITGCQRHLTATVRDASNNTSPFSNALDSTLTAADACGPSDFTLSAASPSSQQVLPGGVYTYTHNISSSALVTRTFTIVYTSTLGWASAPNQITVPPGSSASFNVIVAVPYNAKTSPPDVDSTSVQVFAGSTGSNVVTDTTTAKVVVVNPAYPAVSPGQTKERSGTTITFTHTVTNTGDLPGTFSVAGPTGVGTLPTFVGTPPSGWTVQSATLGTASLAGGASTTLTIVVNTPAGAPAGSVQLSFTIKESAGALSSPVTVDAITVPVLRDFEFSAVAPTTRSSPPGAALSFTYTITNTGNASDEFQIVPPTSTTPVATPTAITNFSASPSGSFSLAAGAYRTVTVTAQIPSGTDGTPNYSFSVTARAVGGTSAPGDKSAGGVIDVTGGGAPALSFGAGTPSPIGASGGTVTFTGTLTNTGNMSAPFSLGTPTVVGSPAGWSAQVLYDGDCTNPPGALNAGDDCTFTLQVTVPNGAGGGTQDVSLSATADNGAAGASPEDVTVSATATVSVVSLRSVELGPASPSATQSGLPGTVLTYTHTLTNTGNISDSFTLSLVPTAPATAGMAVLSPTSLTNVASGNTRTITLTVTVPGGVAASEPLPFRIDALPTGLPAATVSQTDTATVAAFDGATLSPGVSKNGLPGTMLTYTHTLTNTGSTVLSYAIRASNSNSNFAAPVITSSNPTGPLNPGQTATVTFQLTLPTDQPSGTSNSITVEVTKEGDATTLASATDQALVGETYGVQITPDRSGVGYPNASLVFTHTVTNIGVTADQYIITATNSLAWPMSASPDTLSLAPGASQVIFITIDVPNDDSTLDGSLNFGRIEVASVTNPTIANDEATESITIGKVIDLALTADQARAVMPSSGKIRMRDLTLSNFGNAADTIDLSVEGADNGWKVDIAASDFLTARDTNYNLMVHVTVPTDVQPGPTKVITIRATSRFDPTVYAEARLRFVYIAPVVKVTYRTYLPLLSR